MTTNLIQIDGLRLRKRGKKGIFVADYWWDGQHCRTSLKTKSVRVANARAIALASQLQQGLNPARQTNLKRISIEQGIDDFMAYQRTELRRPKTCTKYHGVLKTFRDFADSQRVKDIREIDLSLVDQYRAFRQPQISDRSMHNEGVMLKTYFGWCAERNLIESNPLGSRKFHRPRYEPRGGPNLQQVDAILAIAPTNLMAIIATAAFTGRRSAEIQHLLVEDVDFAGNWIHVISRPGAETKTGNSGKTPIHPRLREILKLLPRSNSKWFFTAAPSVQFPNGDHHLNMRDINEQLQKLFKELGIPAGKKNGGFTFHSLRSFFKTFCIHALVPREVVDKWQDHSGDRRPTAGDLYYKLADEDSQTFMLKVPFGDGKPAADAGNTLEV